MDKRFNKVSFDDLIKSAIKMFGKINKNDSRNRFEDFLKIIKVYELKEVSRSSTNAYHCDKENIDYVRRETTAEHVYSGIRLADYFLSTEKEFAELDRLKIYELFMYHDDIEIETKDVGIAEREKRKNKEVSEIEALPALSAKYPFVMQEKLLSMDGEFRQGKTLEAKFAKAIDKMDALIHELKYPKDWGPKGFDEKNVRAWFQTDLEYSPTFLEYFENVVGFLKENRYFEK